MNKYLINTAFGFIKSYYFISSCLVTRAIVNLINYIKIFPLGLTIFKNFIDIGSKYFVCVFYNGLEKLRNKRIVSRKPVMFRSSDSILDRLDIVIKLLIDSLSKSIAAHNEIIETNKLKNYLRTIQNLKHKSNEHGFASDVKTRQYVNRYCDCDLEIDRINAKLKIHSVLNIIYSSKQILNSIKTEDDKLVLLLNESHNLENSDIKQMLKNKVYKLLKIKSNLKISLNEITDAELYFKELPSVIKKFIYRYNKNKRYLNSYFAPTCFFEEGVILCIKLCLKCAVEIYLKFTLRHLTSSILDINEVLRTTIKACKLVGVTHIDVDGKAMKLDDLRAELFSDVTYDFTNFDRSYFNCCLVLKKLNNLFKSYCNHMCNIGVVVCILKSLNYLLCHTQVIIRNLENDVFAIISLLLVCILRILIIISAYYFNKFIFLIHIMVNINYLLFMMFIVSLIFNGLINSISKPSSIVMLISGLYILIVQFTNDNLILNDKFNFKLKLTMCIIILIIFTVWNHIKYLKVNELISTIHLLLKQHSFTYYNLLFLDSIISLREWTSLRSIRHHCTINRILKICKLNLLMDDRLKSEMKFKEKLKLKMEFCVLCSNVSLNSKVNRLIYNFNLVFNTQKEAISLFEKNVKSGYDLCKILNNSSHLSKHTMKYMLKSKLETVVKSKIRLESAYNEFKKLSSLVKPRFNLITFDIDNGDLKCDMELMIKLYVELPVKYTLLTILDIIEMMKTAIKACKLVGVTHIDVDGKAMKLDDISVDPPIVCDPKYEIISEIKQYTDKLKSTSNLNRIGYLLNLRFWDDYGSCFFSVVDE